MSAKKYKIVQTAGKMVGWVLGSVIRYRRREVLETLRISLPEKSPDELNVILNGMYKNLGINVVEWMILPRIDADYLENRMVVENREFADEALQNKNGSILLTAHTGNFLMMCIFAGLEKIPLHLITKTIKPKWIHDKWVSTFNKLGIKFLPRRNSYRDCRKVLKKGEALGFILDQNMKRNEGIFVDFFGRPACTSPGLAFLSA
ncbi:MAG: lysophospholipid acyltransferase family protein, partial [Lentisphaerae bacterium]|nr:lysophospholipid acyltransferase family protein [Lentisphaerota bacterium]